MQLEPEIGDLVVMTWLNNALRAAKGTVYIVTDKATTASGIIVSVTDSGGRKWTTYTQGVQVVSKPSVGWGT